VSLPCLSARGETESARNRRASAAPVPLPGRGALLLQERGGALVLVQPAAQARPGLDQGLERVLNELPGSVAFAGTDATMTSSCPGVLIATE
jgi:hypothetical protein